MLWSQPSNVRDGVIGYIGGVDGNLQRGDGGMVVTVRGEIHSPLNVPLKRTRTKQAKHIPCVPTRSYIFLGRGAGRAGREEQEDNEEE
jgi:hypothetical protein